MSDRYGFRHTLYEEVVYQRIGRARQVRCHRAIGVRLEAGYGAQASQIAATLAVHFERGHEYPRAVHYLQQVADNALQRYAYQEAIGHLTRGLALLQTLPDTPERAQQELDLQLALGPAVMATQGQAAPAVEQTYERARDLCHSIGATPQLIPTVKGLFWSALSRGALARARELGEQLYHLVQPTDDPLALLEAHEACGTVLFLLGEYAAAWAHLAQGIARIDAAGQQARAFRYDVAPAVQCLAVGAHVLWGLGFPAQAGQRSQEARILATDLAHASSLALAQHYATLLSHRCRDPVAVAAQAEALLALASAHGLPLFVGFGACWQGWARTVQGQGEVGLAQVRQGLSAILATGQTLSRPLGQRLLADTLAACEASGRGDLRAEAYRLQGELLLCQTVPDVARAEACFQQALTIARRQQARSWELRAALSLARLWQRQGKRDDAHALLAPIYGWFTEGFDTADLQETKALLAALEE